MMSQASSIFSRERLRDAQKQLALLFRDMKYADYQQIQFNHDKATGTI